MASIDKYEPKAGGFRAKLAANAAADTFLGVGLNSSGLVVPGAGNTGIVGVLVLSKAKLAGETVDVMTNGEIVEVEGITAGTVATANTTTGVIDGTAKSATQFVIGNTVEATRLVVRVVIEQADAT